MTTRTQLAQKYNTTVERIGQEMYNFAQSEGYLADGTECQNFAEWLDAVFGEKRPLDATEPRQKSDLDYGL